MIKLIRDGTIAQTGEISIDWKAGKANLGHTGLGIQKHCLFAFIFKIISAAQKGLPEDYMGFTMDMMLGSVCCSV